MRLQHQETLLQPLPCDLQTLACKATRLQGSYQQQQQQQQQTLMKPFQCTKLLNTCRTPKQSINT
jgi:hypothetical protein